MRATISAPIRRSRGSSRRFCPSGTRFRRSSSAHTRHGPYTREGVLVLDLARWLLGEQGF